MSTLVVERLRVTVLSTPVDEEVRMSFSSLQTRRACLIEIEAGGLVGIGESWINYPSWAHHERVATLCEGLAPHLIGRDVSDPATVQERLTLALLSIGRQWGAPGPIWQAISGVDLALWDLRGKAEGKSVSSLLSDRQAASVVPAYASGIGPERVEDWCSLAVDQGFTAAKVKLGFGRTQDEATLTAGAAVLGGRATLLTDANQAWTLDEALDMADLLKAHEVGWLEEPLAGNVLEDLESLGKQTGLHLATGENVYGLPTLMRYADSSQVGTIQPDLGKCGGITVAAAVAAHAQETGTALAPHCYGSAVGIAASLQLAGAFGAVRPIELDVRTNPLRTELLTTPLCLEGGSLRIPEGPGLGIELDPETISRYSIYRQEQSRVDR